jgi:hypothetical protein
MDQILPYDDCDIEKLGINLDKSGFVRYYSDGENLYCNIPNFSKHQNPHKNEKSSGGKAPEYSEEMRQVVDFKGFTINLDKSGLKRNLHPTDPADSCILNPDSCILNPDYQNPKKSCQAAPDDTAEKINNDCKVIFDHWVRVMNRHSSIFTQERKSKIKSRLREGYTVDQIIEAINGCAASTFHMGQNDQGKIYNDLTLICHNGSKLEFFLTKKINSGKIDRRNETREQQQERLFKELGIDDENVIEGEWKNV